MTEFIAGSQIAHPDFPRVHPELHHYTTYDGLKGIFETRTLWATHYSHLNDSSELRVLEFF